MADRKKSGLDIILAMGGPKKPPVDEPDDAMSDEDDGGLPPEFTMAWQTYHDKPSAQAAYDMIEACVNAKKSKNPGQLD